MMTKLFNGVGIGYVAVLLLGVNALGAKDVNRDWLTVHEIVRSEDIGADCEYLNLRLIERIFERRTGVIVAYPDLLGRPVWGPMNKSNATLNEIAAAVSDVADVTHEFRVRADGRIALIFWGTDKPLEPWPDMPGVIATAKQLAASKKPDNRILAIVHLNNATGPRAMHLLMRLYLDENQRVSDKALGLLKSKWTKMASYAEENLWTRVKKRLAKNLREGPRFRQRAASKIIVSSGDIDLLQMVAEMDDPLLWREAYAALAAIPEAGVLELMRKELEKDNLVKRLLIMRGLAINPSKEATEILRHILTDPETSIQTKSLILLALRHINPDEVAGLLIPYVRDNNRELRQTAALSARGFSNAGLGEALLEQFKNEDDLIVRMQQVQTLAEYKPAQAELAHIVRAKNANTEICNHIGKELLRAGHPAGIEWYRSSSSLEDIGPIARDSGYFSRADVQTLVDPQAPPGRRRAIASQLNTADEAILNKVGQMLLQAQSDKSGICARAIKALVHSPRKAALDILLKIAEKPKHPMRTEVIGALARRHAKRYRTHARAYFG